MKLIVGLGNPDKKYKSTRHNLGFMAVENICQQVSGLWELKPSKESKICRTKLADQDVIFLQPQTYMNESGKSVSEIVNLYKIATADIWVIHDDLDLPVGQARLSKNSSAAGHRGVQSIIDNLGTKDFYRFRIGIGKPTDQKPTEDYVLEKFNTNEEVLIKEIINKTVKLITDSVANGLPQNTTDF
jgi:peptidyl-tRNA hydrolase, PTH1 family